jgi:hypothetical protein
MKMNLKISLVAFASALVAATFTLRSLAQTQPSPKVANPPAGRSSLADSFVFLELHVSANGEGEGKLSEAAQLSVDESQNVIELRDYANQPLHLVMVRSLLDE